MHHSQVKHRTHVTCPPDRGDPGYHGKVMHVDTLVNENTLGSAYVWVTVRHPSGSKHVWPSNRLK